MAVSSLVAPHTGADHCTVPMCEQGTGGKMKAQPLSLPFTVHPQGSPPLSGQHRLASKLRFPYLGLLGAGMTNIYQGRTFHFRYV